MTIDPKCSNCGLPKSQHHYNGRAFGVCGEFTGIKETDDIVKRMRLARPSSSSCNEAADVITQLRHELAHTRTSLAALTAAMLEEHGCFPMDQISERQKRLKRAMVRAYAVFGGHEAAQPLMDKAVQDLEMEIPL